LIPSSNNKIKFTEQSGPTNDFELKSSGLNPFDLSLTFSKNELDWKLAMLTRHESNTYTDSKEWSDVYYLILGREGLNRYENSSEWEEKIINLYKTTNEQKNINFKITNIKLEDCSQNSFFQKNENFESSSEYIAYWE
jgi:hypothetical protein